MADKRGKVPDFSVEKISRNDETPDLRTLLTNTTCHGVKHIAERDSHIFQKILWLICVTVALGLFLVNVISRAGNYFDYPTNVDVSVHYKESMQFPAVTLCNLNNFR
ncbi:hypothetical protein CAPTEDRAFT_190760 [Capitella teleta]|uniref:Uncharacterized protein n=1 Tax=Capitella teleta TaxID=283909 RepID=R7UPX6_CAPTE|nr:hypothetical protein CAPTEDRAFT_190760 [Capitella teleta]|eukprot:ELU05481.1 hypothetical protein CAPTEDRAFT_190760 [Capitella teleta]